MNPLIRSQILCFLRFSMPSLLIGAVLVGYSLYCLAVIVPTLGDLPLHPPINPRWTFGLGVFLGVGFAFVGVRSGVASISNNGVDSETLPEEI